MTFSSCLQRRDDDTSARQNQCTQCHGSADPDTDALTASAPGADLKGNTGVRYPGVGSHALHLIATETHAAVSCEQCHVVPEENDAPDHYDTPPPAELVFGKLAQAGDGPAPRYDFQSQRCSNTYCHGRASGVWTLPKPAEETCGSCHDLPPPSPHPRADDCSTCHGEVIDEKRRFINPALHVDGTIQQEEPKCGACHGHDDDPAPPPDLSGQLDPSASGVGAHTAHLTGGANSRALACEECHPVPNEVRADGHLDGNGVQVRFAGGAQATADALTRATWHRQSATCSGTWCHGPNNDDSASPAWTRAGTLACDGCHGMPPAAPHPVVENCSLCHSPVVATDDEGQLRIAERSLHVDGVVQVNDKTEGDCASCHGTSEMQGAPPRDTLGNERTTARGVGAHEAHLVTSGRARSLQCEECHAVPTSTTSPGHIDTLLPAEVTFTGVARAFRAAPRYDSGKCSGTFCHGGSFVGGRPSGGTHTSPDWTIVDGSQVTCDSCHGMPPPAPHPDDASCGDCHKNIDGSDEFTHPERHVDGEVTFFLSREDAANAAQ